MRQRIHLTALQQVLLPCLFVPHWTVAKCGHAICVNFISRKQYLDKQEAKR